MTADNVVPLRKTVVEDEHGSDEVAAVAVDPSPDGLDGDEVLLDRETVDVPRAIDPPAKQMTVEDLVGRWDLPKRQVILPGWVKSWTALRGVAWWLTRYLGYQLTFHLTRSPKYAVRATVRGVVGAGRVVAAYWAWLWDREGRLMAVTAAQGADQGAWSKARREWKETVHRRLLGSAVVGALALGVVLTAYSLAPPSVTALVSVAILALLVHIGRPESAPLLDVPMERGARVLRLTSGMVIEALRNVGIDAIRSALKDDPREGIRFTEAPQRADGGKGFQCVVELPRGVTAGEVMEKREKLASGLKRPLGCVWPEQAKGAHPGRLELYVADDDLNTAQQPAWPLKTRGTVDIFKPQPFGTDARGRIVKTKLMFASGVIGAVPRVGKTFALRELLLMGALDPRVKVYAFDKKGSGDLSPLEHVAHAYSVGDDPEDIQLDLQYLRDLQKEMRRRYKVLRSLPKERCPESKVTPELAADRKLGLEPVLLGVDECQVWFDHDDDKVKAEFTSICVDLVKRGPAAGIMTFYATQKPDARSLPTNISANAVWRFCLKVMDYQANDQVLGSGSYKSGVRATLFDFADQGIGLLASEGGGRPQIVKTFYLDSKASDAIGLRAKALREAEGRLTGNAADEAIELDVAAQPNLVDDLPAVFEGNERLWSETIVELLQDARPGPYDGWTVTTFAAAVRDQLGISTTQVKAGGRNQQGLQRRAVLDAVAAVLAGRGAPEGGDSAPAEARE